MSEKAHDAFTCQMPHVAFVYVGARVYGYRTTHSYMLEDSFRYVEELICICWSTRSCTFGCSCITTTLHFLPMHRGTWCNHICRRTHSHLPQSIHKSLSIPEHSFIYVWISFIYVSAFFHIYLHSVHMCLRIPVFHPYISENSFMYVCVPFMDVSAFFRIYAFRSYVPAPSCIPLIYIWAFLHICLHSIHIYLHAVHVCLSIPSYISAFLSICVCALLYSIHIHLRIPSYMSAFHSCTSQHSFICICISFICVCAFLYSIHIHLSISSYMSAFYSYVSEHSCI